VNTRVSLGEPITPIVSLHLAGRRIDAKLDYLFPTGSFKDRGAAVMITAMKEAGVDRFVEDSSGNAGAAMSAYGARAGIPCEIYCPSSASPMKIAQIERTGATIRQIDGPRENTTAAVMKIAGSVFYASHNWHPLFLHGTKTMAYEIAEHYGWNPPDHIVAPAGGGSAVLGLHLGFAEMVRLKRVPRMPHFHAVQVEACAPLVYAEVIPKPSVAEGILSPNPPRLAMIRGAITSAVTVSEAEIQAGFHALVRQGVLVEPTSAVVVPALPKLRISETDSVLIVLTGSGLKFQGKL